METEKDPKKVEGIEADDEVLFIHILPKHLLGNIENTIGIRRNVG